MYNLYKGTVVGVCGAQAVFSAAGARADGVRPERGSGTERNGNTQRNERE